MTDNNSDPPFLFTDMAEAICSVFRFAFKLERKNAGKNIPWCGPNYDHANHFSPCEALKAERLAYAEEDQGRDTLTELVSVALQLGIEQGRRITLQSPQVETLRIRLKTMELLAQTKSEGSQ